jgi:predicted nuclease of predicted toxin-antitoxin system
VRFLIDECLSVTLVQVANAAGYEAYHVNYLGKTGSEDYELCRLILREEYTFVTNNARDFRSLMAETDLHPGVVIILPSVVSAIQRALFQSVLDKLGPVPNLINRIVEVDLDRILVYELPRLE